MGQVKILKITPGPGAQMPVSDDLVYQSHCHAEGEAAMGPKMKMILRLLYEVKQELGNLE